MATQKILCVKGKEAVLIRPKRTIGFRDDLGGQDVAALVFGGRYSIGPVFVHNLFLKQKRECGQVESTRKISAPNSVLMPGLADMHTHPVNLSLVLDELNPIYIFGLTDKDNIVSTLKKGADQRREKGIILSYGLNTVKVKDLTAKDLDAVAEDIPVIVFDPSYHGAVLNSKALQLVKEKARQKVQETGMDLIGHCKENGQVTEDYVFLNFSLVDDAIGKGKGMGETAEKEAGFIRRWLEKTIETGTTHFNDMIVFTPTQLLASLIAAETWEKEKGISYPVGKLYLRPELFAALTKNKEKYREIWDKLEPHINAQKIGLKLLADGSIGSYTARLTVGYEDLDPARDKGTVFDSRGTASSAVKLINELGIKDVRMHAIGDGGIWHAISVLQSSRDILGDSARVGIEHFELSGDTSILDITQALNLSVCMQPNSSTDYFDYKDRLGRRAGFINPLKSILDKNISMTFGTDGMPQSMLGALLAATHHPVAQQRVTLEQALYIASLDYYSRLTGTENPNKGLILIDENTANRLEPGNKTQEQIMQEMKNLWTIHSELDKAVTQVILSG